MRHLSPLRIASAAAAALLALGAKAEAAPIILTNADFSTGLVGWHVFKTSLNGALGTPPLPDTESFDVDGDGVSSLAARFQVGQATISDLQEGGGLFQEFVTGAGMLSMSADVASFDQGFNNGSGGVFELRLDGVIVDSFDAGLIESGITMRATLGGVTAVAPGTHGITLMMTRPYTIGTDMWVTPFQYIDDVSLDLASVPEPATLALLGAGVAAVFARRRALRPTKRAAWRRARLRPSRW